jgi:hypothetical protein
VKAISANTTFHYNQKYEKGGMVEWLGRAVITANCDEESLQQIPATDISNLEKLSLFRTTDAMPSQLPSFWAMCDILDREMPFFAAWLRDHVIPDECVGEPRYGVKAYHDPSLLEISHQSSAAYSFSEILHDWSQEWFEQNPTAEHWEGTALQLQKAILTDPTAEPSMRPYSVLAIGKALAALKKTGQYRLESGDRKHGFRNWKLYRPADTKKPTAQEIIPGTPADSQFNKK